MPFLGSVADLPGVVDGDAGAASCIAGLAWLTNTPGANGCSEGLSFGLGCFKELRSWGSRLRAAMLT